MPDITRILIDKVIAAAQRVHGRYTTRDAYQSALAAELQADGLAVETNVTFDEKYDDVVVCHSLDLVVAGHVGVEIKSANEVLADDYYLSLLEFYLGKRGLSQGLLLNFAGAELKVMELSV